MSPGEYWIGDLCYVMDDEWDEVCSVFNDKDGEYTMSDGKKFAMYSTFYGDGAYEDQHGNIYGVDSGTIGCIKVSDIGYKPRMGKIVSFSAPFKTSESNGILNFGNICINTKLF